MIELINKDNEPEEILKEQFTKDGNVGSTRYEVESIIKQTIPFYNRYTDSRDNGGSILKQHKNDTKFKWDDEQYDSLFKDLPENITDDMKEAKSEVQMLATKRRYEDQLAAIEYIDNTTSGLEYVAKMGAGYLADPLALTGAGFAGKLLQANKIINAHKAIRYGASGAAYGAVDTTSEAIIQEGGTKAYTETLPLTFGMSFILGAGAPLAYDMIVNKAKGRQQEIMNRMMDDEITLDANPQQFKELSDAFEQANLQPVRSLLNGWIGKLTDNKIFGSGMQRAWARGGDVSKQSQSFDLAPGLSKNADTGDVIVHQGKNAMDIKYELMDTFMQYQKSVKESLGKNGKISAEDEAKMFVDADIEFAKQRRTYIERKLEIEREVKSELTEDITNKYAREKEVEIANRTEDGTALGSKELEELDIDMNNAVDKEISDVTKQRTMADQKIKDLNNESGIMNDIVKAKLEYSKNIGDRLIGSNMEGMENIDSMYYTPTLHNVENIKANPKQAIDAYEQAIRTSPEYQAKMKEAVDNLDISNDPRTKQEMESLQKEVDDLNQYKQNLDLASAEMDRALNGEFVDKDILNKMFTNQKLVDVNNIPTTFNGLKVVRKKIVSATGVEISARLTTVDGNRVIEVSDNIELLENMFTNKKWNKPRQQSDGTFADKIARNQFNSTDEMLTFIMSHEAAHKDILRLPNETTGAYETRINQAAMDQMRASKPTTSVYDNMVKAEKELIEFEPKLNKDGSVNKTSKGKSDRLNANYINSAKKYKESLTVRTEDGNIKIDEANAQIQNRIDSASSRIEDLSRLNGISKEIDDLIVLKDKYYRSIGYISYLKATNKADNIISEAIVNMKKVQARVKLAESNVPKEMITKVDDYSYYKSYPTMASKRFVNKFKSDELDLSNINFGNKSYDDEYVPARFRRRTLMVDTSNQALNDFQQHGNQLAMDTYHYQTSGRLALQESVGTHRWDEYKANNKFDNKDDEIIIEDLFTSVLGTKQMPSDVNSASERFFRSMSHYNYVTMGGQFAKYGIGEIAAGIYSTGFRYISELVPAMKEVTAMYKGQSLSKIGNDSMSLSEAFNIFENNRRSRMDDSSMPESSFANLSWTEKTLAKMSKGMFRYSGLEAVTTITEMALPRSFMRRLLSEDLSNLISSSPDLIRYGFTKSDLVKLKNQPYITNEKGIITDFNLSKWDKELANKFKTATTRMSRETIIRPDATRLPSWMVDGSLNTLIKLGRQFMSFTFVAHERLLMRGLNERKAMAAVSAGTSAAIIFTIDAALDEAAYQVGVIDERKDDITTKEGRNKRIAKAIERGSFSGVIGPIVDQVESMAIYGQAGPANKMLGGPTFNRGEATLRSAKDLYEGNYGTKAQAHAIKMSVPFSNMFGVNELTTGLARDAIGVRE